MCPKKLVVVASSERERRERLARWLRMGAAMTGHTCPVCGTPLFRYRGQLFCPVCERRVVVVRDEMEAERVQSQLYLYDLEREAIGVLRRLVSESRLDQQMDPARVKEVGAAVNEWLDVLTKVRQLLRETGMESR